ncbi:MAG: hypothetical protein ACRD0K_22325 [Egibacteraceae bacterium]
MSRIGHDPSYQATSLTAVIGGTPSCAAGFSPDLRRVPLAVAVADPDLGHVFHTKPVCAAVDADHMVIADETRRRGRRLSNSGDEGAP